MADIKSLDIKLNPKGEPEDEEIVNVVHGLRPEWNKEYETQKFQGGSMNLIIKYWKKGGPSDDSIMVRIMGELSYSISDPEMSIIGVRALSKSGCCPNVICLFTNGYVYEYVKGERVGWEVCDDPAMLRLIAVETANYHKQDAASIVKSFPGNLELTTEPQLFPRFDHFLSFIPDDMTTLLTYLEKKEKCVVKEKKEVLEEFEYIKSRINLEKSKVVMQHGDLYPGNFLLDKESNVMKFVDYEWVGYNYQAFDLAYFLNTQFHFPYPKMEVTFRCTPREMQMEFLRIYLSVFNDIPESDVKEEDVESLFQDCRMMALATLLYRAILCYAIVDRSVIPIDLVWFGNVHMEEYYKRKEELAK